MKFESIGLIVNPKAGLGAKHNLEVAAQVIQALNVKHVTTGPGQLGADACQDGEILSLPRSENGRSISHSLAQAVVEAGVKALIVVGGDGTASDVAFAVSQSGKRCPILGIGAGSINAGDLITCKADQTEQLAASELLVESIDALIAGCDGEDLAFAFNDLVIGTTVVGTIDGQLLDLDAQAFLNGNQIPGEPLPVGAEAAQVIKRGEHGEEINVSSGTHIGTVVAGFTHYDGFFGKAIIGGVGLSSLADISAGCLVCDQALVRVQLDQESLNSFEPIHTTYISLMAGEEIQIRGLGHPAVLCADGNPLKALVPSNTSQFRVQPNAVDVLRLRN